MRSRSYVAFYGTLMSGFDSLRRLGAHRHVRLLGPCRIPGRLFDVGEWPTLVLADGVVHGELFEVLDEAVFAKLDPFEAYDPGDREGSSYLRVRVRLLEPAVDAWVYVCNEPVIPGPPIPSGSWRAWLATRSSG